jgi:hypothetical protein
MKGQVQAIVESRFPSQPLSTGPVMAPWGITSIAYSMLACKQKQEQDTLHEHRTCIRFLNIKAYDSLSDHLSSLPYSYQTSSHLTKNVIKNKKNVTDGAENWRGRGR